jgi:hypothetical protein
MKKKNRGPKRDIIPQGVRFDVFRRDNFTCVYCGRSSPQVIIECDHKVAVSKGGSNEIDNLVTACWECNSGKSNKDVDYVPKGPKIIPPEPMDPLFGTFGHSLQWIDGEAFAQHQFQIMGGGPDRYVVRLFSWLDGRPTERQFVSVEKLQDERLCRLYDSEEEWRAAGDDSAWRRRNRRDAE